MTSWRHIDTINPKAYTCGHCGNSLSSNQGYIATKGGSAVNFPRIYICHHCEEATVFDNGNKQHPGITSGVPVSNVTDEDVSSLYDEARNAMSVNSYTSAVLSCRKLLMHVAVAQGAASNLSFIQYVEYLRDQHLIPPNAHGWVDHIRQKGNEANHEIVIMQKEDAERLITFCGMLLKVIYEFPAMVPSDS